MKTVNHCVACGSKNVRTTPGMIADFVVDRMLGEDSRRSPVDCNLITCEECEFVSTDVRFSEEEEARYYKNYLKDEYINHRCSYDGEYLRELLTDVAKSTKYQNMRRAAIVQNLAEVIDLESIESVMDFGGDTGKFIPKELSHADRYVYDIQL